MSSYEINFDGLVGPTHNYSGLSTGNVASITHGRSLSNPRAAALEGLGKMRKLIELGMHQGILPPQPRPFIPALHNVGFFGSDAQAIAQAAKEAPWLLSCFSSASNMWTANAATVCPSSDSADGKVHFTAANLVSKLHRSIEPQLTSQTLRHVFASEHFVHHPPLMPCEALGDEGAANHTRLAPSHGAPGLHLFVYGRSRNQSGPKRYPARQTLEASEAIARLHGLRPEQTVFAQQSAVAIDSGVFHNDVICVGNENTLFFHELCFENEQAVLAELQKKWERLTNSPLVLIRVLDKTVSLADAVRSYLFNSQLVTLPSGTRALIAPSECEATPSVKRYLESEGRDRGIEQVHYLPMRQSMHNGGGPACLRLRVVLTESELQATHPGYVLTARKLEALETWVNKHYRDRLEPDDLTDPGLMDEVRRALESLDALLNTPPTR